MYLIKIGKFIASCRKEVNLTQEQLAEKLYITDRAVSKWERGLSLPDADKMLDLCNILNINVNELLTGERIDMKDYEKKTEELLIELAKQEENHNKKIMVDMWVLITTTTIFYFAIVLLASYTLGEGTLLSVIICVATTIFVGIGFYASKLEVEAGYYECRKCHYRFKPRYLRALLAQHLGTSRSLRCPKCHKITWAKKVMSKEEKVD